MADIFRKTNRAREEKMMEGGTWVTSKADKADVNKDKFKGTMTQADFSGYSSKSAEMEKKKKK